MSRDPAAARDMLRRSGQGGVPIIDIGDPEFKLDSVDYFLLEAVDVLARWK